MPTYQYVCLECGESYEVNCPISQRDAARCPHCGSERKRQDYSDHTFVRSGAVAGFGGPRSAPASGCG